MLFADRRDAGQRLARSLGRYVQQRDVTVLALPRGGVPVGLEVARALGVPLDVFVVRKLGVPGHEELAMGAIASGGALVLNHALIDTLGISDDAVRATALSELREVRRREQLFGGQHPPEVQGKTVILVDDGLATGATMKAAIAAVRQRKPAKIVVAVPVGAPSTCDEIGARADEIICSEMPEPFYGVGQFYRDFQQLSDEEVRALLADSRTQPAV